jgi:hypothetical protein
MKRRHISYWKIGGLVGIVLITVMLMRPDTISATSPDKHCTVYVSATNQLARLFVSGSILTMLTNNETGQHRIIKHIALGNIWDGSYPTEVLWHSSSKKFAIISVPTEMPHEIYDAYYIKSRSVSAIREGGGFEQVAWVEKVLSKRDFIEG